MSKHDPGDPEIPGKIFGYTMAIILGIGMVLAALILAGVLLWGFISLLGVIA